MSIPRHCRRGGAMRVRVPGAVPRWRAEDKSVRRVCCCRLAQGRGGVAGGVPCWTPAACLRELHTQVLRLDNRVEVLEL